MTIIQTPKKKIPDSCMIEILIENNFYKMFLRVQIICNLKKKISFVYTLAALYRNERVSRNKYILFFGKIKNLNCIRKIKNNNTNKRSSHRVRIYLKI